MKKNIIRTAFVAAFALIASYNVYTSQQGNNISELALANVEALAVGEDNNDWDYHIFPCNHTTWNECVYSKSDRPQCSQASSC